MQVMMSKNDLFFQRCCFVLIKNFFSFSIVFLNHIISYENKLPETNSLLFEVHNKPECSKDMYMDEKCTLGLHHHLIVPPSWIVKLPPRKVGCFYFCLELLLEAFLLCSRYLDLLALFPPLDHLILFCFHIFV